jgi:Spy/CpxP family protein refolding chaperone
MPRSRTLALLLAALIALVLAASAEARPPGPPGGGMGGERLEGLVDQLGLDAKTLAAVDEVLDASRLRGRELRRQLREAHDRMRTLLEAQEPDADAIYAQVDVISALEAEAQKNRLGTLLRVRALLPPDARERLLGLMQARGPGSHRRGPPPPPGAPW